METDSLDLIPFMKTTMFRAGTTFIHQGIEADGLKPEEGLLAAKSS